MTDAPRSRAALHLWVALAAVTLAQAALAFDRSMWAWSLNLVRFTPPAAGWALWGLAALALAPPVARRLTPALRTIGDAIADRSPAAPLIAGACAATVLWLWPDRVWFIGDAIVRHPAVASDKSFAGTFYENLPLDNLLHATLPRWIQAATGVSADTALRALGALEGGAFAAAAVAWARLAGARGAAAAAMAFTLLGGAAITMFTRPYKSAGELCLIVLVVGVATLRELRREPGLPLALLAAAFGLALHREAIVFVPIVAWLAVRAWRDRDRRAALARPASVAALIAFAVTAAVMAPRIVSTIAGFDVSHHLDSAEVRAHGGLLRGMFAGTRAADLANALIALAPLAVTVPGLLLAAPGAARGRETRALLAIALYLVVVTLFAHPRQGLFRDWDVIAWAGAGLAMPAAWLIGRAIATRDSEWLGAPVVFAAIAATGLWLIHDGDVARGLDRAHAFIAEPPRRGENETGLVWVYLGERNAELQRWSACDDAMRHAAELEPSRSVLLRWGTAATMAGDREGARDAWTVLTARVPADPGGWARLALADLDLGDFAGAHRAAAALVRLVPDDSSALALRRHVASVTDARGR